MDSINLTEKFSKFDEQWSPRIIGSLNDYHLKLAKVSGEFIWHKHDETDELFFVVSGTLTMHYRDRTVIANPGEIIIVPRGVEHKPAAEGECHIMMIEPAGTVNTGDQDAAPQTKTDLEWI